VIARHWPNTLVFAAAATIASVFFINFCAAIFACGCASLWSGADAYCNIHLAGSRHCPWCAHGRVASVIPWVLIVAAQAAISFWPRPIHAGLRLLSAVSAFPVTGGVIALAYGLAVRYWR